MGATRLDENPGCLRRLLGLGPVNKPSPPAEARGPRPIDEAYSLRTSLLSENEMSFYRQLRIVVGEKYVIFAKVRLADIFAVAKTSSYSQHLSDSNRIDTRHVDFVVCEAETLKPTFVVEVDDQTHNTPKRQKIDAFKNDLFSIYGLKLIRFPAKWEYSSEAIRDGIRRAFQKAHDQ